MTTKIYKSPNEVYRVVLSAPEDICIYKEETRRSSLNFIHSIPNKIFNTGSYVKLDFSNTKKITAAAALLLFAEVSRAQNCASAFGFQFPAQIIDIERPIEKSCWEQFKESGLWESIRPGGLKKLEHMWSDDESAFKTASNPQKQAKDALSWLRANYNPLPRKLSSAVQEAFLNVLQHAYSDQDVHKFIVNRWWQYTHIKKVGETDKLTLLVYDMGSGIPYKFKKPGFRGVFSTKSDPELIEHAMTKGVSSTMKQGRGKGSENIIKPTTIVDNSDILVVTSMKGRVVYMNGKIHEKNFIEPAISGTLIEWHLTLSEGDIL